MSLNDFDPCMEWCLLVTEYYTHTTAPVSYYSILRSTQSISRNFLSRPTPNEVSKLSN